MPASVQTILSRAARRCSYDPTLLDFLSGNDPSGTELLEYLNDCARDIIERVDVAPLSATYFINGNSSDTDPYQAIREEPDGTRIPVLITRIPTDDPNLTLNSIVERVWRNPDAVIETTGIRRRVLPVPNGGAWNALVAWGPTGATRHYRVLGGAGDLRMEFWPALPAGVQVAVQVVTNRWLRSADARGAYASEVTNLSDVSVIPERIMEYGVVREFRERRGLDWSEVSQRFEAMLSRWDNDTKARPAVSLARATPLAVNDLKPIVPDYIAPYTGG